MNGSNGEMIAKKACNGMKSIIVGIAKGLRIEVKALALVFE